MNSTELSQYISTQTGLKRVEVAKILRLIPKAVTTITRRGSTVAVAGLGVFRAKRLPAATLRDPRNQDPVIVPRRFKIKFEPYKSLNNSLL
jgi:nucleoid DNA-binding protein